MKAPLWQIVTLHIYDILRHEAKLKPVLLWSFHIWLIIANIPHSSQLETSLNWAMSLPLKSTPTSGQEYCKGIEDKREIMVIKLVWTSKIMFLLMSCPSDRTWRPQLYTNQGSFAFYPTPAWKQVKICHNGYRMHSHGHWGQCQGHEEELHVSSRMSYMTEWWWCDRLTTAQTKFSRYLILWLLRIQEK